MRSFIVLNVKNKKQMNYKVIFEYIVLMVIGGVIAIYGQRKYNEHFGDNKVPCDSIIHDTVYVDSTIVRDSIVFKTSNELFISIDSVNIDTVSTVINGKVVDSRYHIIFR